tara:strand:+ start:1134 stop:1454 length:321 start_codon:yes stop_codon:yes gene_type:complete
MIVAPKTTVKVTTCSLRDNKFRKNPQSFRKDWNKKYASERSRRIDNVKDTFKFVTDIAKEDVEKFKSLHLEAFDLNRTNGGQDEVLKHDLDRKESRIESSIFDEDN